MTLLAAVAVVPLLLGVAACGGGGTTKQAQTAPSSSASAAAPSRSAAAPSPAAPAPVGSPGVTAANYAAVANGMTVAQVDKLLGPHSLRYDVPEFSETGYTWDAANGSSADVFFNRSGLSTHKRATGTLP